MATNPKRLILDIDVGTDDAIALLILLKAEEEKLVKIEAICCSMGNTTVDNVCRNVIRLLETVGRTDIPVYCGVTSQIISNPNKVVEFHGTDGFGDLEYDKEADLSIVQDELSVAGMYNIAKKYKNDIYLMGLGPLTNVALSMILYADFADCLKEIYIMGGNYKDLLPDMEKKIKKK